MTDYTAKLKAKGLDATGVTEDIARQLYSHLGRHEVFIIEARVDSRTEGTNGDHQVHLGITMVEPAVNPQVADHLRELARTLYQNRALADGQLSIDQSLDDEPTVEGVMAAGAQHRPHPFLPVDASQDNPICDVCGALEAAPVHADNLGDPFTPPDDDTADTDDTDDQDDDPDEG